MKSFAIAISDKWSREWGAGGGDLTNVRNYHRNPPCTMNIFFFFSTK
jgi:hypothetical protein